MYFLKKSGSFDIFYGCWDMSILRAKETNVSHKFARILVNVVVLAAINAVAMTRRMNDASSFGFNICQFL